mgnify:CR=1 FL=1
MSGDDRHERANELALAIRSLIAMRCGESVEQATCRGDEIRRFAAHVAVVWTEHDTKATVRITAQFDPTQGGESIPVAEWIEKREEESEDYQRGCGTHDYKGGV